MSNRQSKLVLINLMKYLSSEKSASKLSVLFYFSLEGQGCFIHSFAGLFFFPFMVKYDLWK